jgi:hypothetical protein
MKLAVVIDVGHGAETLRLAVETQMLLLERLGTRLDSIRLAAPRLLDIAYASALAERPDVLVMVGSGRSARRAGQLAYEQKIPVIFLPGVNAPEWARTLWGALSLEEMVTALARGDIKRVRLGAGLVANQIFFQDACCGLLPFLPELRRDLSDSDTFSEGWQALIRAADVSYRMLQRRLKFSVQGCATNRATALVVRAAEGHVQVGSLPESRLPVLHGTAFHYGPFSYLAGLVRGSLGHSWQGGRQESFTCTALSLEARPGTWLLLDGDPMRLRGGAEFRFIPGAIESCIFAPARQIANDNAKRRQRIPYGDVGEAARLLWNFPSPSHVAIHENRESGGARHRKQV